MSSAELSMHRRAWRRRIVETLFPSFAQGMLSIAVLGLCIWFACRAGDWLFVHAVFSGTADDCRAAAPAGACWVVVADGIRFILAGRYSSAEIWRPVLVVAMFFVFLVTSYFQWGKITVFLWYAFIVFSQLILRGGFWGLPPVAPDQWGGFALSIVLATSGLGLALPLGVVLALARRSQMPLVRSLAVAYIELIRGVPFVAVLFLSSVMLPLLFPESFAPTKVARAAAAVGLFAAAYVAEIIRGGLQTIPNGQLEAARALGMGYVATTVSVLLPQAFRVSIPPLIIMVVSMFKDTSLVVVIGLTDFLGTVRLITAEPQWRVFYLEPLIFAAAVYFILCWFMARIGFRMERSLIGRGAR